MKRFNFDEFLWFIVLILLDLFLIYLVFTKKINFYIGKDMIKYIYISIISISVIAIFQIRNICTPKSSINIKIKLLPIILAILLGIISVNKQQSFKHFELNNELRGNTAKSIDKQSLYEHELDIDINKGNINLSKDSKNIYEDVTQKIIVVNESNPMILEDIRLNPEKYIGRELEVKGFVCKEDYLNNNQFIIGRLIMTYGAADSKVVGIIGKYDKISDLSESQNVDAKGVIGISTMNDDNGVSHNVPVLIIKDLKISD
ncbi:DUF1980 domain-containing protein [Clostridium sp.]|uniref:TIGR03943 family putative permease subunit n=1 Tax=Clostridium sp. TaxID=1506 RepID=UPI0028510262|nr:DUF1980 domain-containing protein [Clostridium sp.]MDR3594108.1 DUF1980 domain-containing protein [Clostridium sp.]